MDGSQRDQGAAQPTLKQVTDAVRDLAALMRAGGLTRLDVTLSGVSIHLRGPNSAATEEPPTIADLSAEATVVAPDVALNEHVITAPMIGTFYISSSPGEPPYLHLGDRVEAGQVIGIIEAMKIMNEIPADRAGTVAEIFVANGQAVEYGSPLLRLRLDLGESG